MSVLQNIGIVDVLLLLSQVVAFVIVVWVGRKPRTLGKGILLGTVAGMVFATLCAFAVGFVEQVLPIAQIEFWLASKLHGATS